MLNSKAFALLGVLFCLTIACGSGGTGKSVARVETPPDAEAATSSVVHAATQEAPVLATAEVSQSAGESADSENLTDEEIATNFTECLRAQGFDVPDPELNADGTVNLRGIRQKLMQDPEFDFREEKTRKAMEACVPLLEGATFAQETSPEDQIALQDNLLAFAQCLRDVGIDAKDPQFSGGPRAIRQGMASMFQGIEFTEKMRESMDQCSQETFGGRIGATR